MQSGTTLANICRRVNVKHTVMFMTTTINSAKIKLSSCSQRSSAGRDCGLSTFSVNLCSAATLCGHDTGREPCGTFSFTSRWLAGIFSPHSNLLYKYRDGAASVLFTKSLLINPFMHKLWQIVRIFFPPKWFNSSLGTKRNTYFDILQLCNTFLIYEYTLYIMNSHFWTWMHSLEYGFISCPV